MSVNLAVQVPRTIPLTDHDTDSGNLLFGLQFLRSNLCFGCAGETTQLLRAFSNNNHGVRISPQIQRLVCSSSVCSLRNRASILMHTGQSSFVKRHSLGLLVQGPGKSAHMVISLPNPRGDMHLPAETVHNGLHQDAAYLHQR